MVSVIGEEENAAEQREKTVQEAAEAIMETLGEYGAAYWVEVLARVMYGVFAAQRNAAEIEQEEATTRALNLGPGVTVDLTGNKDAAAAG